MTWRFCFSLIHLVRVIKIGKYSQIQRFQKSFTRNCTCLQRFPYIAKWSNSPDGAVNLCPGLSKSFGAKSCRPVRSSETGVNGRLLTMFLTSAKIVSNLSSSKTWFIKVELSVDRTVLIWLSQTPPIWDAIDGFNSHSISVNSKFCWVWWLSFHHWMASRSSLSQRVKFEIRFSLLAINLMSALMNEFSSIL